MADLCICCGPLLLLHFSSVKLAFWSLWHHRDLTLRVDLLLFLQGHWLTSKVDS